MVLIDLAICFRVLNIYAHQAHHITKGQTFFQDHSFFSDLYNFADDKYDSLIERYIGTEKKNPDLNAIMKETSAALEQEGVDLLKACLDIISYLIDEIEKCKSPDYSQGTLNMLYGIADELEVFSYKLQQRLK